MNKKLLLMVIYFFNLYSDYLILKNDKKKKFPFRRSILKYMKQSCSYIEVNENEEDDN